MNSRLIKRCYFWGIVLFSFLGSQSIWAQSNFIPLERGDVTERQEYLMFTPGLHLSGSYRLNSSFIRGTFLPQTKESDISSPGVISFDQEARLHIRSTVHRTMALNLELNTSTSFHNADLRANSASGNTPESQTLTLGVRQAYLEYTPYPRGVTKLGQHFIEVGDRRGKVFTGILSGITQTCKAGTWCYQIGALKLAPDTADWMYLFSLDYPFIHEVDAQQKLLRVLRVEMFRIKYSERNVPLGANNAPASRLSLSDRNSLTSQADGSCDSKLSGYAVDQNCVPVYYDANEQEFFGIRFLWEVPQWKAYLDVVSNQGMRRYHLMPDATGSLTTPSFGVNTGPLRHHKKIQGLSSEMELSYQSGIHKFSFLGMNASGDKQNADPERTGENFLRVLRGYYEIVPGSYRGTNFWFNGVANADNSGTGLGHSVNNTTLAGMRYGYAAEKVLYQTGIYELKRQEQVLNSEGNRASYIGLEWDNSLSFTLDRHLKLNTELNLFRTGPAFSFDDATPPPARSSRIITHLAAHIVYSF